MHSVVRLRAVRRPAFVVWCIILAVPYVDAQDEKAGSAGDEKKILEGHSYHGEVFNEGPRQRAYLMTGADGTPATGAIRFPVTTKDPMVQKFITQGVGQLHGFWYFEAERSFRHAASLDPGCAMAYWGMALANTENEGRAVAFIAEAVKRKDGATPREAMYISALKRYHDAGKKKNKERSGRYIKDLEKIVLGYPDDTEAKAFLVVRMWQNTRRGLPISSHVAVDALLEQIFSAEPMHPAHHYRIHLWDNENPAVAVADAARCGQAAPGIAHMWHMPGHIFSRLKRYNDAAWQQEASARVDHAHMIRDRVLPDQIHNFAHNNEWLIRNLMHVGRVSDALDLAKNMIELPRHPKYNTLAKRGCSSSYGRQRLFEILRRYELWDTVVDLCDSPYLEPTEIENEQVKRLRLLGSAHVRRGDLENGINVLLDLEAKHKGLVAARDRAGKAARDKEREAIEADKIAAAAPRGKAADKAPCAKDKKKDAEKKDAEKKDAEKKDAEKKDAEKKDAEKKDAEKKDAEKKDAEKKDAEKKDAGDTDEEKARRAKKDKRAKEEKKRIDKAVNASRKPFDARINRYDRAIKEIRGHITVADGDLSDGLDRLRKAGGVNERYLALLQVRISGAAAFAEAGSPGSGKDGPETDGKSEAEKKDGKKKLDGSAKALENVRKQVDGKKGQVVPLANYVCLLRTAGRKKEAAIAFEELREISSTIDLDVPSPVFERLRPIAAELGIEGDWRIAKPTPADVGDRPGLDSLGPFHWTPTAAPDWKLVDSNGKERSIADFRGRPVVVIFYLGYGCLHCVEQLHAFAPAAAKFEKAGISLVAISTDKADDLEKAVKDFSEFGFAFPLVADPSLDVFKAYRAYDDFEEQPLHGTFLVDEKGLIHWQDVSYEPFMDPDFVLREANRLLGRSVQPSPRRKL